MSDIREALVALLNHPDHAPMSTHDPRDGSCQSCPWPLHEMPPEDIADAILAEFDVAPRGEAEDAAPTGHDHEWQRRQNVTSRGYRMTPYEVCVVDGCGAARQVDEPATCDHERAACYLATASTLTCVEARNLIVALTPPTLPSVEDVARAILMATQAADVDPDYAWNVQYPEVQDELLDQARAVLALFEKGEGRG